MAGIECAKKAFQDIISDFKNFRTAKLMVFTERGMLKVIRKDNFALTDRRREVHTATRAGDSSCLGIGLGERGRRQRDNC